MWLVKDYVKYKFSRVEGYFVHYFLFIEFFFYSFLISTMDNFYFIWNIMHSTLSHCYTFSFRKLGHIYHAYHLAILCLLLFHRHWHRSTPQSTPIHLREYVSWWSWFFIHFICSQFFQSRILIFLDFFSFWEIIMIETFFFFVFNVMPHQVYHLYDNVSEQSAVAQKYYIEIFII